MIQGVRFRCAVQALLVVVCTVPAFAQTEPQAPVEEPTRTVEFLPRVAFHMAAEYLADEDPRFMWDADFGGELDIVDYGVGRFTFEGNYEVVLGDERRAFDPNQGNYILAGLVSARTGKTEVAFELYHQSRHLADRPKEDAVDWNTLGGRVRRNFAYRQAVIAAQANLRGVFMKSSVDYSWEIDAGVRSDVKVSPRVGVLAAGRVRYLGVDGSIDRGNQTGYIVEGGVRFEGQAGAIELFVAGERRIDPYPVEVGTGQWFKAGFRLLSR
ncbi:MAG TPA: hypothetical protein VFS23_25120 [Vicinamibacterales bacterium]|nr:hypothetical protein [Vicinamibacterales bacterium]